MKKIICAVAAILMMGIPTGAAQSLPEKGSWSTEVQFNPFDQDGTMFKLESLKFRYFLTDHDALRLNFGFDVQGEKKQADKDKDDVWSKNRTGSVNIDLGYERHFTPCGRFDFYAGGQFGIQKDFAKGKKQEMEYDDYGREVIVTTEYKNSTFDNKRAQFGFNLQGFAGADFYVYRGLYVGTELGFKWNIMKDCETELDDGHGKVKSKDSRRTMDARFYIEPCIRLGWMF